jgi:hypothetical protein
MRMPYIGEKAAVPSSLTNTPVFTSSPYLEGPKKGKREREKAQETKICTENIIKSIQFIAMIQKTG